MRKDYRSALLEGFNMNLDIVRAKGHELYTQDGRTIIDFCSQYGAVSLGHNNDDIKQTLIAYLQSDGACLVQPFNTPAASELKAALMALFEERYSQVILTNSGAETVEVALKVARAATDRRIILSAQGGFHGKTMGALLATSKDVYRTPFGYADDSFESIPYNDLTALEQRLKQDDVAAFIVEPVQGEGGIVFPDAEYLQGVGALCKNYRVTFILDEIQTGLGKLGSVSASHLHGVVPDIVLLSKTLGGGFLPIGAVLVKGRLYTKTFDEVHSSTFANNGLACVVAKRVLDLLAAEKSPVLSKANSIGQLIEQELKALQRRFPGIVTRVAGKGLLWAIDLTVRNRLANYQLNYLNDSAQIIPIIASYILKKFNLLLLPTLSTTNTLRIQPAITIEESEIALLSSALNHVVELLEQEQFDLIFSELLDIPCSPRLNNFRYVPEVESVGPCVSPILNGKAEQTAEPRIRRFAFLAHQTEPLDTVRSFHPSIRQGFSEEDCFALAKWVDQITEISLRTGVTCKSTLIPSADGGCVEGFLVVCPISAKQMMSLSNQDKIHLMKNYFDVAKRIGVEIVGLGAFTSIITKSGTRYVPQTGIPLTTGASLTAFSVIESIRKIREQRGASNQDVLCVLGASGQIGRLVCIRLSEQFPRLILVGNPTNKDSINHLKSIGGEVYLYTFDRERGLFSDKRLRGDNEINLAVESTRASTDADRFVKLFEVVNRGLLRYGVSVTVEISVDAFASAKESNYVVAATNATDDLFDLEQLHSKTVVCDVGRPPAFGNGKTWFNNPQISYFQGGMVELPMTSSAFGEINIVGLKGNICLGCMGETILLTMAGVQRNFSVGKSIDLEDLDEVSRLVKIHGFRPHIPESMLAGTTSGHKPISILDGTPQEISVKRHFVESPVQQVR